MKHRQTTSRTPLVKKQHTTDNGRRTASVAEIGRIFDDLYSQLDLQLTRMAQIQLQFDSLRSKIRLL